MTMAEVRMSEEEWRARMLAQPNSLQSAVRGLALLIMWAMVLLLGMELLPFVMYPWAN